MPPCRASLPTRAMTMMKSAARALLIQILRPFSTHWSPSSTARVFMRGGIAAGAGLGDRDRGDHPPLDIGLHVFSLLRLGADRLQHAQVRRVRRQDERHAGPAEFLVDRGHGAGRQVVTAEVLGRVEAPQAQILRDRPQPLASARRSVPDDRSPAAWTSGNAARAGSARGRRISRPSRGSWRSLHRCSSINPLSRQSRHSARNRHSARDRSERYWPESCRRDSPWRRRS